MVLRICQWHRSTLGLFHVRLNDNHLITPPRSLTLLDLGKIKKLLQAVVAGACTPALGCSLREQAQLFLSSLAAEVVFCHT